MVLDIDESYITAEETFDDDKLKFYTSGNQRMIIDDISGNVGIGTGVLLINSLFMEPILILYLFWV